MKNTNECPLDESWSQDFCDAYHDLKRANSLNLCQHRAACEQMRTDLEGNPNLSTVITKAILLENIPTALLEINKSK